jgi:hypothetical protein
MESSSLTTGQLGYNSQGGTSFFLFLSPSTGFKREVPSVNVLKERDFRDRGSQTAI